jgi:hypothetical protein
VVVVAAATMGSNEILLRSRDAGGIALSRWLGKGFSGNGNYLGFVDYQFTDPAVRTKLRASASRAGRGPSRWGRTSRASSISAAAAGRSSAEC